MRVSALLILLMTCTAGLVACGDSANDTNNDSSLTNNGNNGNNTQNLPECDSDIADVLDSDIDGEEVTLGQCTLVTKRVAINNDGKLTVEPGSTVLFEQNAGFWVLHDGELKAAGTSSDPILFTGTDKRPGFWRNVLYENSEGSDNLVEHVTIEYAGSEGQPALSLFGRAFTSVRHSTIRKSAAAGFSLAQDVGATPGMSFENNTVTENALAGNAKPIVASIIGASNNLSGNTVDRLEIEAIGAAADITSSTTYQNIGIPYLFQADFKVHDGATWTVEPGAEILMDASTRIVIGHDGAFVLEGTSDAPITLRGKESVAGYWQDFYIENSSSPSNLLKHVFIQDAGSGGSESAAALNLGSGSGHTMRVTFDQVTIRDSAKHGITSDTGFQGAFDVNGCDTVTFEGIAGDNFYGDPICNQ